jgi:hypothetical protein
MAVRLIGWRLHDFLSKGGRVLDPEEEDADFPIEALFGERPPASAALASGAPGERRRPWQGSGRP